MRCSPKIHGLKQFPNSCPQDDKILARMTGRAHLISACALLFILATSPQAAVAQTEYDFDNDGYVGVVDFSYLTACLSFSGPDRTPLFGECVPIFDSDADHDIDLVDIAAMQRVRGHLPIPLRNKLGDVLTMVETAPYSGRQTCAGNCHAHAIDHITNGLHFQQGRTDIDGHLDMRDDIFEDGRPWHFSRGRYGRWFNGLEMTSKDNTNESEFGITTFMWVRDCMGCHPGSGPGEFDRDGEWLYKYYEDTEQFQFGFERLNKTANEVLFDGDYTRLDMVTGEVTPAPWDVSGLAGPDCLMCHRADRVVTNGETMNHTWRAATMAAGENLVDDQGASVPAFAAAGTAGQGWFSSLVYENQVASTLQIDYATGVSNGSLIADEGHGGALSLSPSSLTEKAADQVCARCHFQTIQFAGVWFDTRDVHYSKFNNLSDDDPQNDIPPEKSTTCNFCHPGDVSHNFAKGNSPTRFWRDELDWAPPFRSCRECHLADSVTRHPDAPEVPGQDYIPAHDGVMIERLSCQTCHIPYGVMPYTAVFDSTVTGSFGFTPARLFYSADPLDPTNDDKSRWYPPFVFKTDSDGVERLFPGGTVPTVYWGDWNQNGTPENLQDDTISPVITWRMRQLTGGAPLAGVTDDNGDGVLEVNRPSEILSYIQLLKGNDSHGRQVAANPVLVKGKRVWYEDATSPNLISSFEHVGKGIAMEDWSPYVYGIDHNVLVKEEAWGFGDIHPESGCQDCHSPDTHTSPVFDRLVLVDPCDENGQPVYQTVREMTGLNPP